ncbi:DUF2993 domain-containing protein [Streptomyces spiramenti]|uniref:DUF2993 domain-containing protein n=1 Tax=Streptomyces spiramenti TaxID=2720606 RepID=A0ABX1APU5_9ACTN|nr:DUF2993 domain-containing protein [Streptomyces spiramenti]NJP67736.1 DUF2993 domain-containing protein [Streptomyces spiramenti]
MRALRIGLILLVILGGLAVAADRLAVNMAEGEIASKVRQTQGLDADPSVSIGGFPFLTQLVGKELESVELGVDSYAVRVDDQEGAVEDLTIRLEDVRLENTYERAVAARASGEGTLSYAEMQRLTVPEDSTFGVAYSYGGDGEIELRVTVMGQAVGPAMGGDITVEGDLVRVSVEDIPSFADVPVVGSIDGIDERIRERVDQQRQLSGLPSGVEVDGLEATEDGVTLRLSGTDVILAGTPAAE